MNKFEMLDVHPRDLGNGPVRWTERLIMNIPDRGAAFFGRMIGIYDYTNEFSTDISRLEDIHDRSNKFRELNIWLDNAPRRPKNAHSRICGDFPGVGKSAVLDPNLDIDEVVRWRDYEISCLEGSVMLNDLMKTVWDGDFVQMGLDLHLPIKSLNLIKQWFETPSAEARAIIGHAWDAWAETRDRNSVIRAWEEKEEKILSLPGSKRKEENF